MGLYRRGRIYWATWSEGGKTHRKSLKTDDPDRAEELWLGICQAARKAKRLGLDPEGATADSRPAEVLEEYIDDLKRQGLSEQHRDQKKGQLERLFKTVGASAIRDLNTARIRGALHKLSHASARTQNDYRAAINAFFNWLVTAGRWPKNPVTAIRKVKEPDEPKRRALTPEELHRLLEAAPRHRSIIYRLCATTGLRRAELRKLERKQFDLRGGWITLRAAATKANKGVRLPLIPETVEALRDWFEDPIIIETGKTRPQGKNPSKKDKAETWERKKPCPGLFPMPPKMWTWRRDLEAAGIPETVNGQQLVFHSLRATHITNLWRAGLSAAEVCRYGRLEDVKTAMTYYTHLELRDDELMRSRYHELMRRRPGGGKRRRKKA